MKSQLKAVLLNGASSSGKSTLAKSLQEYIKGSRKEEYIITSIDDFLKMTADEPIYEDDVFDISPLLCQKALNALKNGQGVIIDHVITSERIYKQLTEALKEHALLKVQTVCPLNELEKREKERNNRCVGSAKASFEYLYPKTGYDLVLNTFELTSGECVKKICELL
ncbi:MAG: chloramphenicol phosphotransferase CPT family protein [Oscillospiraceae bacterium]|nr:chloramphenicol phosphotransferase CPT family protein [Oscillospiraceae bacterium]